jgi:hypothetical protein
VQDFEFIPGDKPDASKVISHYDGTVMLHHHGTHIQPPALQKFEQGLAIRAFGCFSVYPNSHPFLLFHGRKKACQEASQ